MNFFTWPLSPVRCSASNRLLSALLLELLYWVNYCSSYWHFNCPNYSCFLRIQFNRRTVRWVLVTCTKTHLSGKLSRKRSGSDCEIVGLVGRKALRVNGRGQRSKAIVDRQRQRKGQRKLSVKKASEMISVKSSSPPS